MFSLSKESEFELSHGLLDLVDNFLKSKSQPEQRLLGLMTAKQLKDELNVTDNTPVSYTHLDVYKRQV